MTAPTHIAFGELVYLLLLTTTGVAVSAANVLVVAVASIAADIDTGSSMVGRMLPAVSLRIERTFGHRTLTHSALFVAGLALASLPLLAQSDDLYACLVIGYATHPFLDTMNVNGVRLFYPFSRVRCVFPFDVGAPGRFRTPTGSGIDRALGALFFAACIPTFMISQQGHERFIRLTQQTIESAVRDYDEFSPTHRVVAELSARNLFTRGSIRGRYEIAGALDQHTLLFRDDQGVLHSLGRAYEAEYSTESAVCYPTEPVRTVIRSVELENQPLGSLVDALEPGARTYVFGELVTRDPVDLKTSDGLFAPVSGAGHFLKLRFATPVDLRRHDLAKLLVDHGRVTVRIEVPPTLDLATTHPGHDSTGGFALLGIRARSGQHLEVGVSVGDTVRPAQLLARVRPDTLSRLAEELETLERAASLDQRRSELASLAARTQALREEVVGDSLEVLRLTLLCSEGFVSAARLTAAERTFQETRDRHQVLERRMELLLDRMRLRAKADTLEAHGGTAGAPDVLRCSVRGVIVDIRRTVQENFIEVSFVIRELPS